MIKDCSSREHYLQLLEESKTKPVFLFKHSTACATSLWVWRTFQKFAENETSASFWRVLVRESRQVSLHIANDTDIAHESPQAILFFNEKPVWNASHWMITDKSLQASLNELGI